MLATILESIKIGEVEVFVKITQVEYPHQAGNVGKIRLNCNHTGLVANKQIRLGSVAERSLRFTAKKYHDQSQETPYTI